MAEQSSPNVYIVAGPNGSGKSTFARLFLPEYADCREFVNADLIAAGLSPFNPESLSIQAGRLMLERIEALAAQRVDFGFETTFAGRGYTSLLRKLKESGYRIHVFFLWLPSVEMALARVRDRVLSGGHFVPEEVVRRRFSRGLSNLFKVYASLLDTWLVFDNSRELPHLVAFCMEPARIVLDAEVFDNIEREALK
ncbi:MAG TPA: zeta toxin family protein [Thermoanaerobaculia bacterium]|nr:zeta toxin family protein [Thermoanaerobaculia bacterium]